MRLSLPPCPAGIRLTWLLAGMLWVWPACADQQAGQADSGIPAAKTGWQEWVDGLEVRATLAPPGDARNAAPAKAGDWCEVRFRAFELAADGVTRLKLLDCAVFGDPPRHVVIGEGREKTALEWGLIGLRPGEGRQVRAPARHWPGATGPVWIELQLIERKPGVEVKALHAPAPAGAARAAKGDAVSFHWTLFRLDAQGDPGPAILPAADAACVVGDGTLVRGLDLGLRGMAPGDARAITIPPYLGYGETGAGGDLIPPGSTLWVMVEMKQVEKAGNPKKTGKQ